MSSRIITVPLPAGQLDDWKRFAAELGGPRKRELDDMNRRLGLTRHSAWVRREPNGQHVVLALHEGPDADRFLERLAASDHEFDRWFFERINALHQADLSGEPQHVAELFLDWRSSGAIEQRAAPAQPSA